MSRAENSGRTPTTAGCALPTKSPTERSAGVHGGAFDFDASGRVAGTLSSGLAVWYEFDDLTPFERGYIEAALRDLADRLPGRADCQTPRVRAAFHRLAPETLAAMLKDCASFENFAAGLGIKSGAAEGARFWSGRQASALPGAWGAAFPPVTLRLRGVLIYQREAA